MANPFIGVRIPPELHQAIIERMQATGQSRSEIVIAALEKYLEIHPCPDRLTLIEKRLSDLEEITKQVK
ncbi:YlcI/YnfO family protein [Leptolyngbya sp. FACHB-261]|uniref:YlcI/YnfO family protein n=1 Tax=Leptolyngbya sp. FACHB-261 TaxID=2692806 RepID=UPI001688A455|nr:YlcI/YnfO family protein [Leptolyngbya sp. FACHB-261]MBD2103641.1 ribbon-helix-helix protein, CopG family [Leptolyngbya sp. FACHB-261]